MHFECVDGKLEKPPVGRSYQQQYHHHRAPPRAARRHSTWTRRVFLRRQSTHEIAKLVYALHNTLISHFRKFRRRAKIGESENSIGKYIHISCTSKMLYWKCSVEWIMCCNPKCLCAVYLFLLLILYLSFYNIFSICHPVRRSDATRTFLSLR